MSLRTNVIANYLGNAWVAAIGFALIPIYIRYLGIEAFGLMGLFALLQAWMALLDAGMTPTLAREMARFTAGKRTPQAIRDLLRTLETLFFGIAILSGAAVWAASGWLSNDWLKADKLPIEVVQDAISIMALVMGLRFVEGIYRSALFGLQRQVWYNGVNAALATLRGIGAVVVLAALSPTIKAFFLWQAVVSLLSVLCLGYGVHRSLPPGLRPSTFSLESLRHVWRFAGGMTGITLLALLLTQVDKLMLSRLLSLQEFGRYSLASMLAGALYLIITPITTALFPKMVELISLGDESALANAYHRGAQLVTILAMPVALLLAFHAEGVIFVWSGDVNLARAAGPVLAALAVGTLLNGLMTVPYQMQLAYGWTSLTLKINLVAVALLVPAILLVVPRYGSLGAAWVWIALNVGYIVVSIGLMHRRILPTEKWRWYIRDVLVPSLAALAALLLLRDLQPAEFGSRVVWTAYLITAFAAAIASATLAIPDFRMQMFLSMCRTRTT